MLERWFGRAEHDGAASELERVATGLPAAILEPVDQEPNDRRQRAFEPVRRVVLDAVAQKVLHGWLQNRHQTLLPLTVNLRLLNDVDARLLVATTAAAVQAAGDGARDECERAEIFLRTAGATPALIEIFRLALPEPQPVVRLLDDIRARHALGPLAFALMAATTDARVPSNALFLQWAAAKLDLPSTVVRSVERRYRR